MLDVRFVSDDTNCPIFFLKTIWYFCVVIFETFLGIFGALFKFDIKNSAMVTPSPTYWPGLWPVAIRGPILRCFIGGFLNNILPNFHVLAISVAAMDQKLFLFLVFEIQPHACLFTSNPQFGLAFLFPELSTCPDARGSSFALWHPNSKQWPVKVKLSLFLLFQIKSKNYYDTRMVSTTDGGPQVNRHIPFHS